VKDRVREIASYLDHKFILPVNHPSITYSETGDGQIRIEAAGKLYILPAEDVVRLDIEFTTAEYLAQYILDDICRILPGKVNIEEIRVGIDEGPGQGAWCSRKFR